MKLHLGCGSTYKEGFVNIDYSNQVKCDRVFDLSQPLDYHERSVDLIYANHLFEHLPFPNIEKILASWHKCLKLGGMLVMEMPDFDQVVRWYLETGSKLSLQWIFGGQDRVGQTHLWGWNKHRLEQLLLDMGFKDVVFEAPQDLVHANEGPCLRVKAMKL